MKRSPYCSDDRRFIVGREDASRRSSTRLIAIDARTLPHIKPALFIDPQVIAQLEFSDAEILRKVRSNCTGVSSRLAQTDTKVSTDTFV
jgi:hypothetical protein